MKRACFITVLVLFLALSVFASSETQPVLLTEEYSEPLLKHIEILQDPQMSWTIEDVSTGSARSFFKTTTKDNYGHINATNWIRFTVTNPTESTIPIYIESSYPRLEVMEFYIPDAYGYRVEKLERFKPFNERPIKYRYFVISDELAPGESKTYYARLHSSGIGSMNFPLTLYTESAFSEKVRDESILYGFFFGIMILIVIYNLYLYIALKNNIYIWFDIYVICSSIAQAYDSGYSYQYL